MIILVEGPDNSGKSVLCDIIANKYHYMKYHCSNTEDVERLYLILKEGKEKYGNNFNVVIDRAFISNKIYTDVFKDTKYISPQIFNNFKSLVDITVMCISEDKDSYLRRFNSDLKKGRPEAYKDMSDIYDAYVKYSKENEEDLIFYDWTIMTEEEIDNFVKCLVS